MKFFSLLTLAFAGVALARGNRGNSTGTSTKSQCRQVERLTFFADLAANTTRLDRFTKNNATRAAAIKAKVAQEAPQLQAMKANATLMGACNQVFAVHAMERSCRQMAHIQGLERLVANATRLDKVTKGNATRAAAIKAKAAAEAPKLTALSGNATLTQFCAADRVKNQCRFMSRLQKEVARAANETALTAKFGNDAAKIQKAKERAARASAKLNAMSSNTTLVSLCGAQAKTPTNAAAASSSSAAAAASASAGAKKSAAYGVAPMAAAQILTLSAVLAGGFALM
ncbi:uncharacterized protein E0L32_010619 [Thyridium curvatum]|uniref:Uncharacterized protein n=1 Tax=Thyridium curvatum TaxID=1093900 RepID=A0A507AK28_9PEZI|nr:uncharacterized protein E0L32_010619 [Thyridium curvatum]TPX07723.1 hypothetical protein E0L32_010619 [Thyridium curvatum]